MLAAAVLPADRRDAAAHLLARAHRRGDHRPARLLPADAPEHACRPRCSPSLPRRAIALHSAWDATLLATNRRPAQPPSPRAITWRWSSARACWARECCAARWCWWIDGSRICRLVRTPPRRSVRVGAGAASAILVVARRARARRRYGFAHREYDRFVHSNHETERHPDPRTALRPCQQRPPAAVEKPPCASIDTQRLRGTGAGTYQQYYLRYRTGRALRHRRPLAVPAEPGRARRSSASC